MCRNLCHQSFLELIRFNLQPQQGCGALIHYKLKYCELISNRQTFLFHRALLENRKQAAETIIKDLFKFQVSQGVPQNKPRTAASQSAEMEITGRPAGWHLQSLQDQTCASEVKCWGFFFLLFLVVGFFFKERSGEITALHCSKKSR